MERTVKIAVCDDEEKYREDIVRFVAEHCMVRDVAYHIDTFASGRELAAPEGRMAGYDIIYLDINMAQMDGMEAARLLREESTDTYLVFVTAFARFAAEGYRVDATRYVLKDALLKEGICESLDAIFGKMELSESRHEFAFREGIHAVQDKDIVFVESRLHELLFTIQIGSRRRLWHMTALLGKAIALLAVAVVRGCMCRKDWEVMGSTEWMEFLLFPVITVLIMVCVLSEDTYLTEARHRTICLTVSAGLVAMDVMVFHLLDGVASRAAAFRESRMAEQEMRNERRRYQELADHMEKQRRLSHDFRSQIQVIQGLCEAGKLDDMREYLEEINEGVLPQVDHIDVNHGIINTVLNEKYQKALEKGILFTILSDDMGGLFLSGQDIAILLSNLLDNAIEASSACSGKKWIRLRMKLDGDGFMLSLGNTYSGCLEKENGEYRTTKTADRMEHGYGIRNVKGIVEAYQGDCVFSHTDGTDAEGEFCVAIEIRRERHSGVM